MEASTKPQSKKSRKNIFRIASAAVILPLCLGASFFAVWFLLPLALEHTPAAQAVLVNSQSQLAFEVHYMENELYPENPIPPNLHFLMSFTDFIRVYHSFSSAFNMPATGQYTVTINETLVINYAGSVGGSTNPVVFTESRERHLSSGEISGTSAMFVPEQPIYLDPKSHISVYRNFVTTQHRQMETEDLRVVGGRNFHATLVIEFVYRLHLESLATMETTTRTLRIDLTSEVYTIEMPAPISVINFQPPALEAVNIYNTPIIAAIVAIAVLSLAGFVYSARILLRSHGGNLQKQLVDSLLKKYHSEIVISRTPVDVKGYTILYVRDFQELLKLAINLNKHIISYSDLESTEFYTIVDNFAYCYQVMYDVRRVFTIEDELKIEARG